MNYLSIIYNALTAAQTKPVAPLQMIGDQEPPFVVFNIDSIEPLGSKVKVEPIDLVTVTVMIFNNDLDAAQADAYNVRLALSCLNTVQNSWPIFMSTEYNDITRTHYIVQTYEMRMAVTPPVSTGIGVMAIGSTFIVA